jgi:predicted dehydrogenase
VRVALIGCGRIARVHQAYLRELATVELVGACDSAPGARSAFTSDTGLATFASIEELLANGKPEAAHILTPPSSHAPLAIRLLDAGVNVLIEKPFALHAAEADEVIAAARRAGRWVTADHNRYFDPVVQEAARKLERGALGKLVGVDVFQGAEIGEQQKGDHWVQQLPGGGLHNLVSHPLYLVRRFAGPMHDLRVVSQLTSGAHLEEVRLIARGQEALVNVTMSVHTRPFMNRLTLYGTRATLEVNLNNMTLIERRPKQLPKLVGKVWPNLSEASQLLSATVRNGWAFARGRQRFYPGIGAHLRALYDQVSSGGLPPVGVNEARDVVAWYDEILAQSGLGERAPAKAVNA